MILQDKSKLGVTLILDTSVCVTIPDILEFAPVVSWAQGKSIEVVLPDIILTELEHLKNGRKEINYRARKFVAGLEKTLVASTLLSKNRFLLPKFVSNGNANQRTTLKIDRRTPSGEGVIDNQLITLAGNYTSAMGSKFQITLATRDRLLRIRAMAEGIHTYDPESPLDFENHWGGIKTNGALVFSSGKDELIPLLLHDGAKIEIDAETNKVSTRNNSRRSNGHRSNGHQSNGHSELIYADWDIESRLEPERFQVESDVHGSAINLMRFYGSTEDDFDMLLATATPITQPQLNGNAGGLN